MIHPKFLSFSSLLGWFFMWSGITHLELTPTVASLLSPTSVPTVETLITIGEMLTPRVVQDWTAVTKPMVRSSDSIIIDKDPAQTMQVSVLQSAYGPTEAAVHVSITNKCSPDMKPSNLGTPLETCSWYVMQTASSSSLVLQPVEIGMLGELCLGGSNVGRGYLNRPMETSNAFITHPVDGGSRNMSNSTPQENDSMKKESERKQREDGVGGSNKMYRTGDLVRMLPDGTLEILGRMSDDQVKLNGQRMEVLEVCVVVEKGLGREVAKEVLALVVKKGEYNDVGVHNDWKYILHSDVLVCFVAVGGRGEESGWSSKQFKLTSNVVDVILDEGNDEVLDIQKKARESARVKLPKFMVPSHFILVSSFPRLPSGKTDKKSLVSVFHTLKSSGALSGTMMQDMKSHPGGIGTVESSDGDVQFHSWTPTEQQVAESIAEVIGLELAKLSRTQPMMTYGVDSLLVIRLSSVLRRRGLAISVHQIMREGTIQRIAKALSTSPSHSSLNPDLSSTVGHQTAPSNESLMKFIGNAESLAKSVASQVPHLSYTQAIYPCTTLQAGMLLESFKTDGRQYYNSVLFAIDHQKYRTHLNRELESKDIETAWVSLVAQHEILRTGFVSLESLPSDLAEMHKLNSSLYQAVWDPSYNKPSWSVVSIASDILLQRTIDDQMNTRGKITSAELWKPPVHASLITSKSSGSWWLLLTIHHAIYDGWSLQLLKEDFNTVLSGKEPQIRPQFHTLVHHNIESPPTQADLDYWVSYLQGVSDCSTFPKLTPTPQTLKSISQLQTSSQNPSSVTRRSTKTFKWDSISPKELDVICSQHWKVSPQSLLQAVWADLLARYHGHQDVVFGLVVSGRTASISSGAELETAVGPFINTLPFRVFVPHDSDNHMSEGGVTNNNTQVYSTHVKDLLETIQATNARLLPYVDVPLSTLISTLRQRRSAISSRKQQLFDSVLVYNRYLNPVDPSANVISLVDYTNTLQVSGYL
jgi:aryl carrier-like protein